MRRVGAGVVLLTLGAGCSPAPEEQPASTSGSAAEPVVAAAPAQPPVLPVRHSYFPRRDDVDYWETIPTTHSDAQFFLQVHPRIKTPAEGPWIATFSNAEGAVRSRLPGLRVDVATGNFLFLCSRRHFASGDWTLALEVMEGGLAGIEPQQTFRFRVE